MKNICIVKLDSAFQGVRILEMATVYQEVFGGEPWNEFWPIDQIVSDFKTEMLKTDAVCYLALEQDKIVGFTWGYKRLVNEKIDEELESPGLADVIIWRNYFYIDEVAVLSAYRGQGVGRNLVINLCRNSGFLPILLRTKNNSAAYNMFIGLGGKVVLNISRERVIMVINP
jgi:ribosomal protein S18 acetylase RimI-like enzyme